MMDIKMTTAVEEYLVSRRKRGFDLHIEGQELLRFARFAEEIGHRGPITTELAVRWAKLPEKAKPIYWARRLDIVRRFAMDRVLIEPRTEVPPKGLLGRSYCRPTPYIYSKQEISALLDAASQLGPPAGLRPATYTTLFGLLASTGLRISEALSLTREDVDLEAGLLRVTATKFKKSRLVPIHASTREALRHYSERRNDYHPISDSRAFFLTERATSLKYWRTLMTFIALRETLGWAGEGRARAPRIHDLRHTFAVRCLVRWYEEGADIDQKITALATYLGHVKVTDTYWYLTAVPELLALAGNRFEDLAGREKGDLV